MKPILTFITLGLLAGIQSAMASPCAALDDSVARVACPSASPLATPSKATPTWVGAAYAGAPLLVGGLLMRGEDAHFARLRTQPNSPLTRYAGDGLPYLPAAVMLGLKTFGVESRSSWTRMVVADATSLVMVAGAVKALKHSTHVERPDGSDSESFPSGHAATAFMTATMLNHEYGHLSPWVGIGAYGVASATALMRVANHKHWVSDVMTGASIGILATQAGYWLADAVLGTQPAGDAATVWHPCLLERPSFLGMAVGVNVPLGTTTLASRHAWRTSAGTSAGVEGAWFFSPYIGVGARLAVSNTRVIVDDHEAEDNTLDAMSLAAGMYLSYPLALRWLLGGKVLAGCAHYPRLGLAEVALPSRTGLLVGSGVSLTYRTAPHSAVRLYADIDRMPAHAAHSTSAQPMLTAGLSLVLTR